MFGRSCSLLSGLLYLALCIHLSSCVDACTCLTPGLDAAASGHCGGHLVTESLVGFFFTAVMLRLYDILTICIFSVSIPVQRLSLSSSQWEACSYACT